MDIAKKVNPEVFHDVNSARAVGTKKRFLLTFRECWNTWTTTAEAKTIQIISIAERWAGLGEVCVAQVGDCMAKMIVISHSAR